MSGDRRFLAPEVVQTSAMDCGPASLKSLLEGFGVAVGYDRLREACQTDVDGTSIDTMEEVAWQLGIESEQIMLPPDHVFVPEARALPAILVVANAIGVTHFVVVWRCHGPWVQVMDPAIGRHWVRRKSLMRDVYRHRMAVPAVAWRDWAGSQESREVLDARMAALKIGTSARQQLMDEALADADWGGIATLDAAIRMTASIVTAGALPAGRAASAMVRSVLEEERESASDEAIPDDYWSVRPLDPDSEGQPQLELRGAVLVRAKGRHPEVADGATATHASSGGGQQNTLSPELAAALAEPTIRPGRELFATLAEDGFGGPLACIAALVTASMAVVVQVLLFRGLLDVGLKLVLPEQRLVAAVALGLFLLLSVLLEVPIATSVLRFGRRLEVRLRRRFLEKTARLADRYFRSRLASDMADRSHSTHLLHDVPEIASSLLRTVFQAVFTAAGIIWLDPGVTPLVLASLATALAVPWLAQPVLSETDLRVRNHAGALSRFYLDALLGLVPARNHGAERPLRREHESLLLEWNHAVLRSERAKLWMSGVQAVTGYGLAIWLVFRHLGSSDGVGQILLLAYWAIQLQALGESLGGIARLVPQYRNITRRLLEPLGIEDDDAGAAASTADEPTVTAGEPGVAVSLHGVRVVAGGHQILDEVSLQVAPGEHVAVVGPSGAGKSSLVGLLLGWHEAAAGEVRVDGKALDAAALNRLRHQSAWVDPAIQLWNRSLLANLRYGADGENDHRIGEAIDTSLLRSLLEKLPQGLQTDLGEGGALVSGGEGQRVRMARALLRPAARLVVLDEPFRGLDRSQRRELTHRARTWWRHTTLFYISHDLVETRDFDRVLVIEGGRLTESGAPAELAANPESRYAALLAAEVQVRREFEAGARWRRWRVADGALSESKGVAIEPPREATDGAG